jgi:alpha-tubulin suppressor-like RCC1 family protein
MLSAALAVCFGWSTASAANTNIIVWGTGGVTSVPDFPTNAIAVAGGDTHGMALLADRTVQTWGAFAYGGSIVPPEEATNIFGIASGSAHAVALKDDGTVAAWGRQFLSGTPIYVSPEATNVVELGVGTGAQHILVLREDGTVVDWGSPYTVNIPPSAYNLVSVAAGAQHGLALRADGKVIVWGQNDFGQTNVPASATNIVAIATTWHGNIALRADGRVLLWGSVSLPNASSLSDIVEVAGRGGIFGPPGMALRQNGTVVASGAPSSATNIMAIGGSGEVCLAVKASGPPIFPLPPVRRTVAVGQTAYLRLRAVGALPMGYQWSFQGTNIPGATNAVLVVTNAQASAAGYYSLVASNALGVVTNSELQLVVSILVTQPLEDQVTFPGGVATFSTAAYAGSPVSFQWQFNNTNLPGSVNSTLVITNAQYEHAGTYRVIASTTNASMTNTAHLSVVPVAAWGFGLSGQTKVPATLTNVIALASGRYHSLALKNDGSVAIWGNNFYGQSVTPAGLTDPVALSAGYYHNLALDENGSVTAWGAGGSGQTSVPQGLIGVVSCVGGESHSLALRADGSLVAWGNNTSGQTNVPSSKDFIAIAAGRSHNIALRAGGSVIAWGSNSNGQTNVPPGLTNIVGIAAGDNHSVALRSDGTVAAWGNNSSGQTNVPTGLTNVVAIAAGAAHSIALKSDGGIAGWGSNTYGQSEAPAGLTNVVAIATKDSHNLALVSSDALVVNGLPVDPVWASNTFSVSLFSLNNRVYRLEHKDSLQDSNWVAHPLVAGTGSIVTFTDPTATGTQRFYRVRRW